MRRDVRILLGTLAVGAIVAVAPRAYAAMAEMDTFRIADVEVRGLRYLTEDSIVDRMELGNFASVWGDTERWTERIISHPLVKHAEVQRRLPNGLRVTVEERRPVALAATPTLEPVDAEGYRLPIDPVRYSLDLPILTAGKLPPEGSYLFPHEVRTLAAELGHLLTTDEEFVKRVSTIRNELDGTLVVHLTAPDVELRLPRAVTTSRLRQAEAALADAMGRNSGRVPAVVDVRFNDQVVVRHATVGARPSSVTGH